MESDIADFLTSLLVQPRDVRNLAIFGTLESCKICTTKDDRVSWLERTFWANLLSAFLHFPRFILFFTIPTWTKVFNAGFLWKNSIRILHTSLHKKYHTFMWTLNFPHLILIDHNRKQIENLIWEQTIKLNIYLLPMIVNLIWEQNHHEAPNLIWAHMIPPMLHWNSVTNIAIIKFFCSVTLTCLLHIYHRCSRRIS